jgi:hypothetical protein
VKLAIDRRLHEISSSTPHVKVLVLRSFWSGLGILEFTALLGRVRVMKSLRSVTHSTKILTLECNLLLKTQDRMSFPFIWEK